MLLGLTIAQKSREFKGGKHQTQNLLAVRQTCTTIVVLSLPSPSLKQKIDGSLIGGFVANDSTQFMYFLVLNMVHDPGEHVDP